MQGNSDNLQLCLVAQNFRLQFCISRFDYQIVELLNINQILIPVLWIWSLLLLFLLPAHCTLSNHLPLHCHLHLKDQHIHNYHTSRQTFHFQKAPETIVRCGPAGHMSCPSWVPSMLKMPMPPPISTMKFRMVELLNNCDQFMILWPCLLDFAGACRNNEWLICWCW